MTNDEATGTWSRRKLLASAGAAALASSAIALPTRASAEPAPAVYEDDITDEILVEAIRQTFMAVAAIQVLNQSSGPDHAKQQVTLPVSINLKDPDLTVTLELNQGGYENVNFPGNPVKSLPSATLEARLLHLILGGEYSMTRAVGLKEIILTGDRDVLRGLSSLPLLLKEQYKMSHTTLLYKDEV